MGTGVFHFRMGEWGSWDSEHTIRVQDPALPLTLRVSRGLRLLFCNAGTAEISVSQDCWAVYAHHVGERSCTLEIAMCIIIIDCLLLGCRLWHVASLGTL